MGVGSLLLYEMEMGGLSGEVERLGVEMGGLEGRDGKGKSEREKDFTYGRKDCGCVVDL